MTWLRNWRGKFYIATSSQGLLIYGPREDSWKIVTPDDGLPAWNVGRVFPVDGGQLYGTTGISLDQRQREFIDFFFDTSQLRAN
ncbi:MAG: hypothetical protein WD069_22865 [Planctomycetales bacterium]